MEVKDVIQRLVGLGLDVRKDTGLGHHKVYDPTSGAWLFNVSSSPSDVNWHFNIKRHCRRLGLPWDTPTRRKNKTRTKHAGAIDLNALARAQAAAAASGAHVPQLSDLDETTSSEFWQRIKVGNVTRYSEAATEEVIENMTVKAEEGRIRLVRARLERLMAEKGEKLEAQRRESHPTTPPGKGAIAEFARIAVEEVAPARQMRAWSGDGAAQAIGTFLRGNGVALWSLNLIDATIDHLDGLKWGIQEKGADVIVGPDHPAHPVQETLRGIGKEPPPEPEPEPAPDPGEIDPDAPWPPELEAIRRLGQDPSLRDRYASALLDLLLAVPPEMTEPILARLDKLILGE